MKKHCFGLLLCILFGIFNSPATLLGQSQWSGGLDIMSQYIWRGIVFDDGVNLQPYAMYNVGGLELGTSASISLKNTFNEFSFWTSYTHSFESTDVTFYLGDFYYLSQGSRFFNFDGVKNDEAQGEHSLEAYIELSSAEFPFSIFFSGVIWNDPDRSLYTQASYRTTLPGELDAIFNFGASLGRSRDWYYTQKSGLVNVSMELSKSLSITPGYAMSIYGQTFFNPYNEYFHVVVGVGF